MRCSMSLRYSNRKRAQASLLQRTATLPGPTVYVWHRTPSPCASAGLAGGVVQIEGLAAVGKAHSSEKCLPTQAHERLAGSRSEEAAGNAQFLSHPEEA